MIKSIDKKYCTEKLVQLMPYTDSSHLIVSPDEIILLKIGDKVLINKYLNHPSRNLFPYHEKERNGENFTELFEYNKMYLNFRGSVGGYSFSKDYFFKDSDRTLWVTESLPVDERKAKENSVELDRNEIEKIFDSSNYDSMYVLDTNGRILFARNDKDKIYIGEEVIPSDDEIIKMELDSREVSSNIGRTINHDTTKKKEEPKTIDEIRNFKIYGPVAFANYVHMLLTIKDGKFDLKWFRVDFVEKNKFRLTYDPINIGIPTVDDVIEYSNKHEIKSTPEPSFGEVHTKEEQEIAMNALQETTDNFSEQKEEQSQKSENDTYRRLQKLL